MEDPCGGPYLEEYDDGYVESDPLEAVLGLVMTVNDYSKAADMMRTGIAADMAEDALSMKCIRIANIVHDAIGADPLYADLFRDFIRDVDNMREEALEPETDPLFLTYFMKVTLPGIAMVCLDRLDPKERYGTFLR